MIKFSDFPHLTLSNHRITSGATTDYNCVAWAAQDTEHWWQPGEYWRPENWPEDDFGLEALVQVFQILGYVDCGSDGQLEPGYLKVALYASNGEYTHVARQLPDGKWTSKLGKEEDIEHETPRDVADGVYGTLVRFLKKREQL